MALFQFRYDMNIKDRIKLAAIHMKEANIGLATKSLFTASHETYPHNVVSSPFSFNQLDVNFGNKHISLSCFDDYIAAYFLCPPLAAVINRKTQTYINGKTWVLKRKGKNKEQESFSNVAEKIKSLLAKPNPLQTWQQFEAEQYVFTQLFGYSILYFDKPVGFPNHEAESMWNISPQYVSFELDEDAYYKRNGRYIKSAVMKYNGQTVGLPLDSIYIFKDLAASLRTPFFPDSRIKTIEMPVNNVIGAYESRNMLINSRGAIGMIVNKTKDSVSFIPMKQSEKEDLHREYNNTFGLRKGQVGIIISQKELDWIPMVSKTKDLMLFEEITDDNNRIADAYQFPAKLLGSMDKGGKEDNFQTATRNLYQDATIPESLNMYSQWEDVFDAIKYDLIIDKDYSHVEVLQPDRKAEAEARLRRNQALQIEFRNNVITLNQWRVFNGDDPVAGGDVYYTDIKDQFKIEYNNGQGDTNIDETFANDDLNPRDNIGDALNRNPEN